MFGRLLVVCLGSVAVLAGCSTSYTDPYTPPPPAYDLHQVKNVLATASDIGEPTWQSHFHGRQHALVTDAHEEIAPSALSFFDFDVDLYIYATEADARQGQLAGQAAPNVGPPDPEDYSGLHTERIKVHARNRIVNGDLVTGYDTIQEQPYAETDFVVGPIDVQIYGPNKAIVLRLERIQAADLPPKRH